MTNSDKLTPAFQAIGNAVGQLKKLWYTDGMDPPNNNLDDIVQPGNYRIITATISGSPALSGITLASGSSLIQSQYNSNNAAQILITHPNNVLYMRTKDNGSWGSFERMVKDTEVPLLADLLASGKPGELILGRHGNVTTGTTQGSVLFYNGDLSANAAGKRIAGSIRLEATSDYGLSDLVFGVHTSNPMPGYDDPESFEDDTIEVFRLVGETQTAEFAGEVRANGEKLVAPSVLQKRYHMLSDYAPSSDAAECHAAVQAFFTAGEGREMVINKPTGSASREYRMLDRSDGTITLPLRGRIICEPGARLNWNDWSTANSDTGVICLQRIGTWGAGDEITGAIARGTDALYVGTGNGSKYAPGQRCFLGSTEMFTLEEETLGTKGEYLWVSRVVGDSVHFSSRTKYSYLETSTNTLYPDTGGLADLHFEGLQMIGAGPFDANGLGDYDAPGDRGVHVANGNFTMRDGQVEGFDFINIFPVSVTGRMENVRSIQYAPESAVGLNSYGISPSNACDGFEIIDCETLGGKEGISPSATGSAFGIQGVTHNLVIRGGKSEDCRRSGIAFHDYHHEWRVENRLFLYCEQGLDVRTRNGHIVNNVFRHMGAFTGSLDCGVQFGSGAGNILLRGNTYEDVLRGHWMPAAIDHEETPGDFSFLGEVIRSTKPGYGTLMAFNGSARTPGTTELGTMVIENADYTIGNGGGSRAVEIHGRWKVSVQGTFRGGNGAQVVYLRAPDSNNSAGNGPINPSIKAKYDSTFAPPLVQYNTGIVSLDLEGIGHRAPGQSWQDNVYLNVPSLSPGQSTKLSATVTGVGLGDNVQITPAVADDYMTYYAHPTGTDTIEVTATNVGAATQNPDGGQYYITITKRKT